MGKVFRWLALVGFAVVVSVVGLELTLQGAALVVGATGRDPVTGWISGNTRVLAVGDSSTYGLFLPPEESWPAQFEGLWNAEVESPKIEVINLGYPGTNSSVLLNNLPGMLDTFRPDVVLIMIGTNDFWTDVVDRKEEAEGTFDRASIWLREHSRVYKLAYMVRRSFFDPGELDLGERLNLPPSLIDDEVAKAIGEQILAEGSKSLSEVRYGDRKFALGYTRASGKLGSSALLEENLKALADRVKREGSEPVLLTYPSSSGDYARPNRIIRRVAARTGVRLVDIGLDMMAKCPDSAKCPDLFFPDHHAKQPGYTIAARKLVEDLRAAGPLTAPH